MNMSGAPYSLLFAICYLLFVICYLLPYPHSLLKPVSVKYHHASHDAQYRHNGAH